MKSAPAAIVAFLSANTQFLLADLYTFTLLNGTVLRYTDATQSIVVPQTSGPELTWVANDVLISGAKLSCKIGVDVDEQQLKLAYLPTSMVAGQPFGNAIRAGLFDVAIMQRDRVVLPAWGQPPVGNGESGSDGRVMLFYGRVATIEQAGRVSARMSVKGLTSLLTIDMPRNLWQPSCLHTLYDAGCTLSKAAHGATGTVGAGATNTVIPWSGALAAHAQGTIRFASGANVNLTRTVTTAKPGSSLTLGYPLDVICSAGDQFVVYEGCDKTLSTCGTRFGNTANFRGFPFVPPPETAY